MKELLKQERLLINKTLDRLLPPSDTWPCTLHQAMRYAVLGGGKRIRPILARAAYRAAGGDPDLINEAAAALEMIHSYSLVHDDLPAMDDDVLRRGRETVHVAYDEATAILVGDALLTEGLLVLARHPVGQAWAVMRGQVIKIVAEAVSSRGMVGGQMEDLEAERENQALAGNNTKNAASLETRLELIHRHKTGCLLQASVEIGAVLAGVTADQRSPFLRYGQCLGLAFQVADDILDATASAEQLGKSPGKDAKSGKLTYVTLYGLGSARSRLNSLENEMVELAQAINSNDTTLSDLARFIARRTS